MTQDGVWVFMASRSHSYITVLEDFSSSEETTHSRLRRIKFISRFFRVSFSWEPDETLQAPSRNSTSLDETAVLWMLDKREGSEAQSFQQHTVTICHYNRPANSLNVLFKKTRGINVSPLFFYAQDLVNCKRRIATTKSQVCVLVSLSTHRG